MNPSPYLATMPALALLTTHDAAQANELNRTTARSHGSQSRERFPRLASVTRVARRQSVPCASARAVAQITDAVGFSENGPKRLSKFLNFQFMAQTKTKTNGAAPMQAADSTRSMRAAQILRAHGYRQGASHALKGSRLDFYSGPLGNVIVQVWPEGNGVSIYADWPLGLTWEATEIALEKRQGAEPRPDKLRDALRLCAAVATVDLPNGNSEPEKMARGLDAAHDALAEIQAIARKTMAGEPVREAATVTVRISRGQVEEPDPFDVPPGVNLRIVDYDCDTETDDAGTPCEITIHEGGAL